MVCRLRHEGLFLAQWFKFEKFFILIVNEVNFFLCFINLNLHGFPAPRSQRYLTQILTRHWRQLRVILHMFSHKPQVVNSFVVLNCSKSDKGQNRRRCRIIWRIFHGNQGTAISPHQACDRGTDNLTTWNFFKGTQDGFVIEESRLGRRFSRRGPQGVWL